MSESVEVQRLGVLLSCYEKGEMQLGQLVFEIDLVIDELDDSTFKDYVLDSLITLHEIWAVAVEKGGDYELRQRNMIERTAQDVISKMAAHLGATKIGDNGSEH